jgi:uncharacterized membrane protein (UPF0127 family)
MILYNKTTNKKITNNLKIAKNFYQNLLGLLKEKEGTAMLFKTRFGIHTFFMKYPIDVIVLNKNNKVIQIKKNLKPNNLFIWSPQYAKIIEIPSANYEIKVGDVLSYES